MDEINMDEIAMSEPGTREAGWSQLLADHGQRARYSDYVERCNRRLNAMVEFDPERQPAADSAAAGAAGSGLSGLPFVVKDNIAVQGFGLTCASRILERFRSPYTATAVTRLQRAGARVVGKTNLDEFGMGSSNEHSSFGQAHNPWDTERSPGGSSGGTAAAVAAGMAAFGLGSDTGGSIRQPAAFCGVYGLKPTYGAVSRFGLVAYASSFDVIGAMARSLPLLEEVFLCMSGADARDQTTIAEPLAQPSRQHLRVGILERPDRHYALDPAVADGYRRAIEGLRACGYTHTTIELPMLEYVAAAYYTIASAEASANLARYNGIRYGPRPLHAANPDELVRATRTEGFGFEVKLRILAGAYVLRAGFQDRYYHRAQRIRHALRMDMERLFRQVDLLLLPVFPTLAFTHGSLSAFHQKQADIFGPLANLTGLPALSFPVAVTDGLPVGMQLMAPALNERRLFQAARACAGQFSIPRPPGFRGALAEIMAEIESAPESGAAPDPASRAMSGPAHAVAQGVGH